MKKIILGLGLLCAGTGLFARDVPQSVKDRFIRDYPNTSAIHWKMVNGRWDASFRSNGNMMMACYDAKGHHIDSRMPVTQSVVPDKVIHQLRNKYPGEQAHSFTRIDRPHKRDLYKVNITHRGTARTIYMDKNGHQRDYASR
ncbi:hypothetical protein [Puia sp.]|jgi:hypothetical protein|uniref:hypothetical protein n=1 Tax=Puia sp. TaxID=2045100 RepID=UPI002F3E2C21